MSPESPAAPAPQPQPQPEPPAPRGLSAPTATSTGDADIDAHLGAMNAADPDDLDAAIAAGHHLHDLLRDRLSDDS